MNTLLPPPLLDASWQNVLAPELTKPYFKELMAFVENERNSGIPIYPPHHEMFQAFYETPFDQVKVVIVGQDPYHGPGQAHGLCFSVPDGVPPPPSLKNIFKEMQSDLGIPRPTGGGLLHWAKQGVLLLNATLSVREGEAMSHRGRGWEAFTDAVIQSLYERMDPPIFVLWGRSAEQKCKFLLGRTEKDVPVLVAAHPSPLSAYHGFFGCRHFSKINALLVQKGKEPIKWEN